MQVVSDIRTFSGSNAAYVAVTYVAPGLFILNSDV